MTWRQKLKIDRKKNILKMYSESAWNRQQQRQVQPSFQQLNASHSSVANALHSGNKRPPVVMPSIQPTVRTVSANTTLSDRFQMISRQSQQVSYVQQNNQQQQQQQQQKQQNHHPVKGSIVSIGANNFATLSHLKEAPHHPSKDTYTKQGSNLLKAGKGFVTASNREDQSSSASMFDRSFNQASNGSGRIRSVAIHNQKTRGAMAARNKNRFSSRSLFAFDKRTKDATTYGFNKSGPRGAKQHRAAAFEKMGQRGRNSASFRSTSNNNNNSKNRGMGKKKLNAEQLDAQLDKYFMGSEEIAKDRLDEELDAYMSAAAALKQEDVTMQEN
jgi:hypothetical protein